MRVRQVMEIKTLTIQWNNEQLPVLPVDPGAYLTFSIHNSGNALELTGNRAGLLLLAKAALGMWQKPRWVWQKLFAGMDSISIWMTCIASTPREKAS